jgi:hypothetical protein
MKSHSKTILSQLEDSSITTRNQYMSVPSKPNYDRFIKAELELKRYKGTKTPTQFLKEEA